MRIDYNLVPHLIHAWKIPIRISPETYQKFKSNPPARIRRKAEKQRQEREAEEKRRKENEERALQVKISLVFVNRVSILKFKTYIYFYA